MFKATAKLIHPECGDIALLVNRDIYKGGGLLAAEYCQYPDGR